MDRTERLLSQAGLQPSEAVFIHKPANVFYLSGFDGEGMLVLAQELRAILTDFRYVEQARRQAPGWQVLSVRPGYGHTLLAADTLAKLDVKRVYIEEDYVTVKAHQAMRDAMPDLALLPLTAIPEKLRSVKDEQELALIRKACAISCEAFDLILGEIRPGLSEKEIRLRLDFHMLALGAEGVAFSSIVASGPNGSLPHAVPGDRKLAQGDLITLDFGAKYGGYCADMTRTLALGEPSKQLRHIYDTVLEAQTVCQDALGPGKDCRAIDQMARDIIAREGYGEHFGHGLGHSLGIDIHEEPRLSPTAEGLLEPGMMITVEPGIYVPGLGGVRIENSCLITSQGAESLISAPRELMIL